MPRNGQLEGAMVYTAVVDDGTGIMKWLAGPADLLQEQLNTMAETSDIAATVMDYASYS